jgi:hypothetical protein
MYNIYVTLALKSASTLLFVLCVAKNFEMMFAQRVSEKLVQNNKIVYLSQQTLIEQHKISWGRKRVLIRSMRCLTTHQ